MSDETDVLRAIDQLRRDLNGYHGQLVAHNDLQRHCDNQRERIVELEGLYAKAKAERDETAMSFCKEHDRAEFLAGKNAKLRELARDMLMCLTWQYEPHSYMSDGCDCCRFRGKTSGMCGLGQFKGRARELGVEV